MMRIGLFLLTNIAIMIVIGIVFRLLGLDGVLAQNGVDLNLNALLVYSAVIGMSGSIISLFASKWMAKRGAGVQLIETPRNDAERWLLDTVRRLSEKAGIGMPEVGIFNTPQANAFATGWNRNSALVAVSTGLLERFERDEAEAVMAHEIGHVANGDMVTLALVQGVVNTFVVFFSRVIGHTVDRVILKNERGHGIGYFITSMIAQVVLGFLASAIVMWFSRWREFRADDAGATLGSREGMIKALARLQQESGQPSSLPDSIAAFGISGGLGNGIKKLFASHPPLEERIRALQQPSR